MTCQVVLWSVARTGLRPSNGTWGAGVVWGSWWLRGVLGPPPPPTLRVPTPPSAARSSFHGCGEVEAGDAHGHVCGPGEGRKPVRSGSGSRTAQCLRRGSTRGGLDAGRCRPRSRASFSDVLPAPEAACSVGQTRAPRGRQDVARGMVRVQQLSWGDGALGAPWLRFTGGTETRPRVWGAFPTVPSTRGSHVSTGRAGRPVRSARGRGVCSYSPLVCVCSLQCIFKIPKCRRSLSCGICSKMPSGCPRLWVEPSPVRTVVSCAQSCDGARV